MKKIIASVFLIFTLSGIKAQKFDAVFNNKNLDGWYVFLRDQPRGQDTEKVFSVKDKMLLISGKTFGYICTIESYSNFHLKLEFKWGTAKHPPRQNAKRDSGILYYFSSSSPDVVWPRSIECQVQETDCGDFWLVDSTSLTVNGKHYPPTKNQQVVKLSDQEKPSGEWNTIEVIAKDGKCTHIVNGVVVNEGVDANVREGRIAIAIRGC